MSVDLILGDCLEVMATLPDNSVDTIITDPPYGLEFMGKDWDKGVPGVPFWAEMLRVAKPGACLMAMGGTRTYHRLASAIEDAGWRIIDMLEWLYGSGFPKSYDIGKGMDKAQGVERKVAYKPIAYPDSDCWGVPNRNKPGNNWGVVGVDDSGKGKGQGVNGMTPYTLPATPEAQLWDGWGTALKPAHEPICVAYKPREGTYVENALKWGVAGLWIDGGRVGLNGEEPPTGSGNPCPDGNADMMSRALGNSGNKTSPQGRFPANVIHDGSDEVLRGFPETTQIDKRKFKIARSPRNDGSGHIYGKDTRLEPGPAYNDSGSAARFFYCAKASRSERNAGLEGMEERERKGQVSMPVVTNGRGKEYESHGKEYERNTSMQNHHPTVKPVSLMEYLVRLTRTPTGGVVLDPFMGSGTTGIACVNEGRDFIGIEQSEEYLEIAYRRIEYWQKQPRLL